MSERASLAHIHATRLSDLTAGLAEMVKAGRFNKAKEMILLVRNEMNVTAGYLANLSDATGPQVPYMNKLARRMNK